MENQKNMSHFYQQHVGSFKVAYKIATDYVLGREIEKRASFQLKDWEFLSANLANFMPEISEKEYENIYHKLLINHSLSASSFSYVDLDSMEYMKILGNTEFLEKQAVKQPKIFCTYHLGGYRAIFAMLLKTGYPLALVVDKRTLNQQGDSIQNLTDKINEYNGTKLEVRILEAENPEIGKNMAMALLAGCSILIFLDGNTGVGGLYNRTEKQLKLKFLNQNIYSRTGIATLSHAMRIPIVPIISYYETFNQVELPVYFAGEPIVPIRSDVTQPEYVQNTTMKLYKFLEVHLQKYYDQWESWFYFHKFLSIVEHEENWEDNNPKTDLPAKLHFNSKRFGVFKLNEQGYLFDKKRYRAFPTEAPEFKDLAQVIALKNTTAKVITKQFDREWLTKLFHDNILI